LGRNVRGGPTPGRLAEAYREEQARVFACIGQRSLAELPSLAAWRQAFSAFGVKPTQYRSAAEALLRRLTKKGELPEVNLLTDLGNLVSIRYALPVAVLDTRQVAGAITVCFAAGDEAFTELDGEEIRHPEPGEVIFLDETSTVHARRWCWRQSAQSAAREDTIEVLVTVEGQHPGADADVQAALADLVALLREHAGASVETAVLSPNTPEFRPR
jgi:DNA/RNA-binding domain of Phe-tRNA-synthetase-like protein